MLFTGGQLGVLTAADPIHRLRHRNGILTAIQHTGDPTHRIGVTLTDTLTPEGIVLTLGQNGRGIQPVQREQAGIPANRDKCHISTCGSSSIHSSEMLGDFCMGVKAVDDIEAFCKLRCHFGQIRGAAAAEDHHIDPVLPVFRLAQSQHRHIRSHDFHRSRIPTGEYRLQLHIRVLTDGAFHALGKIAIANDTDFDHNRHFLI